MRIDWTPIKADEDWTGEEPDHCVDGADQEFYGTPWCEAGIGDVFATWSGEGDVRVGRRGDDHVSFWNVPAESALDTLKAARLAFLEGEISRMTKERAELIPDDGRAGCYGEYVRKPEDG